MEAVFKSREPKRYLQVKAALINNDTQLIVFCSDITKIKKREAKQQQMRSTFFSSVAHELRTPLNSILPILKMVLALIPSLKLPPGEKITPYLKIILNSSHHLQSVIEDALDISRIENNKFQLFKELCTIREAVKEVCDIMRF